MADAENNTLCFEEEIYLQGKSASGSRFLCQAPVKCVLPFLLSGYGIKSAAAPQENCTVSIGDIQRKLDLTV